MTKHTHREYHTLYNNEKNEKIFYDHHEEETTTTTTTRMRILQYRFDDDDYLTKKKKPILFYFGWRVHSIPFRSFIHSYELYISSGPFVFFVLKLSQKVCSCNHVELCVCVNPIIFSLTRFSFRSLIYFPSSAHTQLASFFFHNLGFFSMGKKWDLPE